TQEVTVFNCKGTDGNAQTEETALLHNCARQLQKPLSESKPPRKLRQIFACPPQGLLARTVTNVILVWAVVWSITGSECLPGGNIFGILFLFFFAVIGGKIFGLIRIPTLPPLPPLLGMLLAGFLIRNTPFISDIVQINPNWSAALRNIALSVILVRAGLGLDPKFCSRCCLSCRGGSLYADLASRRVWC
uniref:Solute carrier family 9 member B2 n=1 Tax=Chelonoidis abingdonii TaxID=106734 RepID=A0A8C0GXJ1_CHEAB